MEAGGSSQIVLDIGPRKAWIPIVGVDVRSPIYVDTPWICFHFHDIFVMIDPPPEQFPKRRSYLRLDCCLGTSLKSPHFRFAERAFLFEVFERLEKNRFLDLSGKMTFNLSRNCLIRF